MVLLFESRERYLTGSKEKVVCAVLPVTVAIIEYSLWPIRRVFFFFFFAKTTAAISPPSVFSFFVTETIGGMRENSFEVERRAGRSGQDHLGASGGALVQETQTAGQIDW